MKRKGEAYTLLVFAILSIASWIGIALLVSKSNKDNEIHIEESKSTTTVEFAKQ